MQLQEEEIKLTCRKCGSSKSESEFYKDWRLPLGRKKTCIECTIATSHKRNYGSIEGRLRYVLKRSLDRNKWENNLDIEYLKSLWKSQDGKCAICGLPMKISPHDPLTASIDRIDSRYGYLKGNVQLVGKNINKMKMDAPQEVFIELCKIIARKHS